MAFFIIEPLTKKRDDDMLNNIPEEGEKVECIKQGVEGLTKGKMYDVMYRGGDHTVIFDDNSRRLVISVFENMENFKKGEPNT